jgi:integrase
VRLTPGAVEALKLHKINQDREKACLGSLWQEQGLVFPSSIGTTFNPSNLLNRSFEPLLRRAGLSQIRGHDPGHTLATLMFFNGEQPKIVQEILGHAQITFQRTLGAPRSMQVELRVVSRSSDKCNIP